MTPFSSGRITPHMKHLMILSAAALTLLLSGCNTFKGVGEDITGAASWSQEKMTGESAAKKADSDYVNPPQFPKGN